MSTSTTASAILARDFSSDTTDRLRDVWTKGKMRHVVEAARGHKCIVVIEGLAEVGVELMGVGDGYLPGGQGRVRIRYQWGEAEGQYNDTDHHLEKVGAIIVLDYPHHAKHEAWGTYTNEVSAAIQLAQELHGPAEGRAWGRWRGECTEHGVYVRYEPHLGNPHFADQAGTRFYREFRRDQYEDLIRPTFYQAQKAAALA